MSESLNKATSDNAPSSDKLEGREYNFKRIEEYWQDQWNKKGVYKVSNESDKPKYYVLDMFPYPSGAGLHVGHPLGYITSDIYARYKRLKGFNVLHPMGYDAFGLPAEQYAIEHGVHPAESTAKNIATFRSQLDKIGFCYDWSREVNTSNPEYYKWTQWIFLKLFKSWYNRKTNKTEHIDQLIKIFEQEGNVNHPIPNQNFKFQISNSANTANSTFITNEWKAFDEKTKQSILMEYRIAYCGYGEVNWCEALGTVLANDEVVNGVSERGGYPVEKKRLRQWYMRITEYADRLLQGLQTVDFSDAMKEMQSNWIGKSSGAEIEFKIASPQAPLLAERGDSSTSKEEESHSDHYFKTGDISNWQTLKEFGRANRKNSTEAEDLLWQEIRNNKVETKVRRQHNIKGYIVDFALLEVNLVIEVDGDYHNAEEQKLLDDARELYLNQLGFAVLRFTNEEVLNDLENVLKRIKQVVKKNKESKQQESAASFLHKEKGLGDEAILKVYTTRPDTIFGVDFMVLAPEHELVEKITTEEQKKSVEEYIAYVKSRSERERIAEKKISGVFTGAYAINPFNQKQIPIWISEYVLAGYGTGAIMAVPSGDERDHKFAKHFNLLITNIIGDAYNGEEANPTKDALLSNSDFLNGMVMRDAIEVVINKLDESGIGKRKINYKMRDAAFSRQRYWGEPFPIKWIDGIAYPLDESELPLRLPHVESYKPGPEGEGPLTNINDWKNKKVKLDLSESSPDSLSFGEGRGEAGVLETNTMPGYAGSSWYFLRYMDPHNDKEFCDKKVSDYWNQVDLYVGGTEHAVGHLLYSRMWTKALYDLNLISFDEPFKRLLNQGMITGKSYFFKFKVVRFLGNELPEERTYIISQNKEWEDYDLREKGSLFAEAGLRFKYGHQYVDSNGKLTKKNFKKYILENDFPPYNIIWDNDGDGEFILLKEESEKMSKSKFNVDNPDDIIAKYGADTFRMYEMFLGPVEMSKPWDTKGIEGVHRFLKKLWRLFFDEQKGAIWTTSTPSLERAGGEAATPEELKILHRTIKKIEEDTERFSYNTAVSAFMVCVNELTDLKCHKKEILEPLLILLAPYAPHIAEELYQQLNNSLSFGEGRGEVVSILNAPFPTLNEKYLIESAKEYPISINGKLRTTITIDLDATQPQVEEIVLANTVVQKWLEGKSPKKIIFVKGKMVNVVM